MCIQLNVSAVEQTIRIQSSRSAEVDIRGGRPKPQWTRATPRRRDCLRNGTRRIAYKQVKNGQWVAMIMMA
jgi:hypothetical protein